MKIKKIAKDHWDVGGYEVRIRNDDIYVYGKKFVSHQAPRIHKRDIHDPTVWPVVEEGIKRLKAWGDKPKNEE